MNTDMISQLDYHKSLSVDMFASPLPAEQEEGSCLM